MTDLATYLSLPYTLQLRRDEDGDVVATVTELPGCVAHGTNEMEALEAIKAAQAAWLSDALDAGSAIPVPAAAKEELPSGKWVQRVPRTMHQRLARVAKEETTSLNQLVIALLSEALALREARTSFMSEVRGDFAQLVHGMWENAYQATWQLDLGACPRSLEWAPALRNANARELRLGYERSERHPPFAYAGSAK